jgi:hypothetical protein
MKKLSKSILTIAVASLFAAGLAFAAAEKAASKTAKCCADAQAAGKKCTHGCCVESAKKGDNCTKCKGEGKIEQKAAAKK